MNPLRKFKVRMRYTKGQVKKLKKEDPKWEKDKTIYDVLAIDLEKISSTPPGVFPTEADIQRSETNFDEDDEDALEEAIEEQYKNNPEETATIMWFLIASPSKGTFDWIDSTKVKYIQEE